MLMVRPVVVARGYACAGVVPLACLRGLAGCSWCAGGGGRVYLRRDCERMSEARPVLMAWPVVVGGDDVRRRGRAHLRGDRCPGGRWWWCLRGCGGLAHLRGLRCGVLAGYGCGVPLADDVPEAWQVVRGMVSTSGAWW